MSGSNAISSADLFGESETVNSGTPASGLRDGQLPVVIKMLAWPLPQRVSKELIVGGSVHTHYLGTA